MNHLNNEAIAAKKANIDKTILNTALELVFSFGFKKMWIGDMLIKDVFDGSRILPEIIADPKKDRSIPSAGDVATILEPYIKYLQDNYSIEPDAPLFPKYYDDRGKKNLQRHTYEFSLYRDLQKMSKTSLRYHYDMYFKQGMDDISISKTIENRLGKGERTIKNLSKKPLGAATISSPKSVPSREEVAEFTAARARKKSQREKATNEATLNLEDSCVESDLQQKFLNDVKLPGSNEIKDKIVKREKQRVALKDNSKGSAASSGLLNEAVREYDSQD